MIRGAVPRDEIRERELADVLLQWSPKGLDVAAIKRAVAAVDGVSSVHDLHVWSLTADAQVLSAHIVTDDDLRVSEATRIVSAVKAVMHDQFSIEHVTLEVESAECLDAPVCVSPVEVADRAEHGHRH